MIDKKEGPYEWLIYQTLLARRARKCLKLFALRYGSWGYRLSIARVWNEVFSCSTNDIIQKTQKSGESLDHDIIKQVGRYQYGQLIDELVWDRLVSGIQNDQIRERLLSKKDLTLTKSYSVAEVKWSYAVTSSRYRYTRDRHQSSYQIAPTKSTKWKEAT